MTDFSGRTLRVRELHNDVLNLIDNKVEKVIIKASSKEGFINGLYATINVVDENGNTRSYQTPLILDSSQGIAYCYVKYGLSYDVEVQAYGETVPPSQHFVSDRSARDVEFYYNCTMSPLGTWIEATDGSLVSSDNWKTEGSGKTAQSVVLITADHQFRIGLTNAYSTSLAWGGYGTDVTGITNRTAWTLAVADFNAKGNTDAIIAALNPNWKGEELTDGKTSGHIDSSTIVYTGSSATTKGAPAAEACRLYSSGNITAGKWDLPAFGHLYLMYLNKAAINACLTACGGTKLTEDYNWSSTEYSGPNAWYLNFAYGNQYSYTKNLTFFVRAVSAF